VTADAGETPSSATPPASTPASGTPKGKPAAATKPAAKDARSGNAAKDESGEGTAKSFVGANPLFDQNEAYRNGLTYLGHGNSAFVDGSQIHELQIGTRIVQNLMVGDSGRLGPGPVRESVLAWVRATYVKVADYDGLLAVLCERRIMVLRGLPGTGRTTTALHLLNTVAAERVARIAEDLEIERIGEPDIQKSWGYLLETDGETLHELHLDRLGTLLRERDAHCVVIVDLDPLRPDTLGGYVRDHTAPDLGLTVASHIRESLRNDGDQELIDRIQQLAKEPATLRMLGPKPYTSEAVELASLLVMHGRGKIDYDEVLTRSGQMIERQVLRWFAPLRTPGRGTSHDVELRTGSMRIALAVFSNAPYDVVVDAAEKLAQRLITEVSSTRSRRRPVFADDRGSRLATMRCRLEDGQVLIENVPVPTQKVLFEDERYPRAILTFLWQWHHSIRPVLVAWLKELAEDSRGTVWVRAALALGMLCALDFSYVLHELVEPWAMSDEEDERMCGAVVLDLACLDERVRPAVRHLVRLWVRGDNDRLRWTAAVAQSRDSGLRSVDESLNHFRIVGTWRVDRSDDDEDHDFVEVDLPHAASWSVASLFAAGAVQPVLQHLRIWLAERRNGLRDLALRCILQMMVSRPLNSWSPDGISITPGRERWPLLLAVLDREPDLAEEFADVVWQTLLGAPSEESALEVIRGWIREGERDPECRIALESFLPLLITSEHDRDRLLYLLRSMRIEWIDPLRPDVAGSIERALTAAPFSADGSRPTSPAGSPVCDPA
jgi:hypothetical protein